MSRASNRKLGSDAEQPIRYGRGRSIRDAAPETRSAADFDAFELAVLADRAPTKGATYITAAMRPDGAGRPHRGKDFAESRRFLPFDIDRIDGQDALRKLRAAFTDFRGFGWETHSSTDEAPRCRLILELDRECDRVECDRLGRAIQGDIERLLGDVAKFDPSVYRSEQPCYAPPTRCKSFRFDGTPVLVDETLLSAPAASERPGIQERAAEVEGNDPVVAALTARRMVRRRVDAGKIAVICPFDGEHSGTTSDTSTVYLLPNFGGVRYGKFHCLHLHCADRSQESFLQAMGLEPRQVWLQQAGGALPPPRSIPAIQVATKCEAVVEFSDDSLALSFVKSYGETYKWTPGLGWMANQGSHWSRDENLTRYQCSRIVCRAAAGGAGKSDAKRLTSARTVAAVVTMAQSDPRLYLPASEWDRDPMVLNTPSGIVDLRTGRMRQRTNDYVTQFARVSPDFTARCPTWLRFLGEVFVTDAAKIEFAQRMVGYMLTGDRREQKMFFAWGTGSNGKSTLIDLLLWLMGSYSVKLPPMTLMQSAVDRHPTELAQLLGKRLAVSNELDDGQFWAESRIKELTGDETLTARFMRQDFFQFRMTQKHLVAGNYRPRLKGGDPAIARRMVLIPFTETFEGRRKDTTLPDKLKAEAPAILAWAVEGAVNWSRDGLMIPESIRSASAEYLAENDDLALWIDERCERTAEEGASDLYASFSDWKRDRGEHAPSQTSWGARLAAQPGVSKRRSNGWKYVGVRLTPEERSRVRQKRGDARNAA